MLLKNESSSLSANTDYSTFSKKHYTFKQNTNLKYQGIPIDFSDLKYRVLLLPENLTYNQVVWIKFNKTATNMLKKVFIKGGLRIKNLLKIEELEWDFFNDRHDAAIYKQIIANMSE